MKDFKQRIEDVMEQMTRAQQASLLRGKEYQAGLLIGVETSLELLNVIKDIMSDIGEMFGVPQ